MTACAMPALGMNGYDICDQDADGMSVRIATVYSDFHGRPDIPEMAARLLVLARNMPGGWQAAIELIRAETIRRSET